MAIEEPKYTVESKASHYEIRKYGPIVVAETKIDSDFENAGNQAFRVLAGYIFGANKSKTKIAMTAPVNQTKNTTGFVVQFTMPQKYILETLPTPDDSKVQLRQLPARKVAVYTYSGSWSESRYAEKLLSFKLELINHKVTIIGEPSLARYNSPFQLRFLRRNEIWFKVE